MFIHWGPYSVAAGEWQGKPGKRDAHLQQEFRVPLKDYRSLVEQFNPVKFDADAWVRLARDAGLGYIVYVSKHHDGFAMFDSPSDPYNLVQASPFKRDPLKELAAACKRHGIVLCVYYSLGRDWSVPGVPTGGWRCNDWDFPNPPADAMQSYLDRKVKPQLKELLTQYGPIGSVWFDTPEKTTPQQSDELRKWILNLQPNCLINARIGNNRGDFDIHEQKIPAKSITKPWEACMTIGRRWGYDRNDHDWKSPEMLVRCMVDVASKGGNFLINIGPTGLGEVPAPSVERLKSLGEWLRVNGESIRGTTAAGLPESGSKAIVFQEIKSDGTEISSNGGAAKSHEVGLPRGWRATRKPGCLYLHLFDVPADGTFRLEALQDRVSKVTMQADPQGRALKFSQQHGVFAVELLPGVRDPRATVLKVELDPAEAARGLTP
jgi:alpha-L-fucosidase